MTSQPFLLCCLNYEFYNKYQKLILDELFPKELKGLYATIVSSHSVHKQNLTIEELRGLHFARNPTLTEANKINIDQLLKGMHECAPYSQSIAEEILHRQYKEYWSKELANEVVKPDSDPSKVQLLLDKLKNLSLVEDVTEYVTTDVEELIKAKNSSFKWRWRFPAFQDRLGNIGPGVFIIVGARPDCGKTAFHVDATWNDNGWLDQGCDVHVFANEENAYLPMMRGISCKLGQPWEYVENNIELAQAKIAKVRKHIFVQDSVGVSMDEVDAYARDKKPGIIIMDQLDKFRVKGNFSRTDEKLGEIYVQGREIAKRRDCAVVAFTQASAEAHGKLYYDYDMLAGSKTGKAAEGDAVVTIGMQAIEATNGMDTGLRVANFSKNKLTGNKTPVQYMLDHKLARINP